MGGTDLAKARKAHAEELGASTDFNTKMDWSKQLYLRKNLDQLVHRESHNHLTAAGTAPENRAIGDYLKHGFINLDKPANPSSHEVVSWVKRMLELEKTGHSGTLDPKVTGCLIVCLERATRLVKSQQKAGKEYVCVIRFHDKVEGGESAVAKVMESCKGALFQRPPLISAVKRQLRIRTIYDIKLQEFSNDKGLAVFWVSCEAGTYIRTLCVHMGLLLGVGAHMQELRRVRSGLMSENENLVTMHELRDAWYQHKVGGDETALRRLIQPLEALLVNYPRILIKDSSVASVCHGAKLGIKGVIAYDASITIGSEVVLMTAKGEAVAIAIATVNATDMGSTMFGATHGLVAQLKRVIMDRDIYEKQWGKGPVASRKKEMKKAGTLDKYGRPNEKTPADWIDSYQAPPASTTVEAEKAEASAANEAPPSHGEVNPAAQTDEAMHDDKPKRKHEGETAEERAERKKRKQEKKEKKEKKAARRASTTAASESD